MLKTPFLTKEEAENIIKKYPTPFHIYDEEGISSNAKALKEAFQWNKGYKEYFAVKANPNPFIIEILRKYDCGCDCSSKSELKIAKAIGATGHEIMFSSNDTPVEEFRYCNELGGIINLDDITQINKAEIACKTLPKTMSCRYNPGGVFEMSNGIMDNPGDAKYGMTHDQILESYKILKQKGVENFGLHSFLCSNTVTNEYYPKLARILFNLAVEIKEKCGVKLNFINLSGGIGIPYTEEEEPNDIYVIGEGVHKAFDEILVPNGLGDISIYTELGRFMTGPFGALITRAINEKHTYKDYIGVDACAADLIRPAMYGAYHHITVLGKEKEPKSHKYDITGSLCENNDKFAIDRMLPEIDTGDIIYIHDTGAHGHAMGYNYNGKLRSAELLKCRDGSIKLIRRREEERDYFSTLDCFDIYKKLISE